MALTHTIASKTALAAAILAQIQSGTIDTNGDLVFLAAADAVVATLPLSPTAGIVSGDTLTYNSITSDTNAAGGTIVAFKIQNRDNVEVYRGTVTITAGGGDIELSSLTIGAGDTVAVSALTYNIPS